MGCTILHGASDVVLYLQDEMITLLDSSFLEQLDDLLFALEGIQHRDVQVVDFHPKGVVLIPYPGSTRDSWQHNWKEVRVVVITSDQSRRLV